MRCIEMYGFQYLKDFMGLINRNMRCIEISPYNSFHCLWRQINRNMRCIEIPIKAKQGKTFGD